MDLGRVLLHRQTTVSNASTRALLNLCTANGIDVTSLLSKSDIAPECLSSAVQRLEYGQMVRLWDSASIELNDECLGLRLAELVPFGAYGALDYLILTSGSISEAYAKTARYFQFANGGAELRSRKTKDGTLIELHSPNTPSDHLPRSAQFTFALILSRFGAACGVNFLPLETHLTFAAPKNSSALQKAFGRRVEFCQSSNRILLDDSIFRLPGLHADPSLNEMLEFSITRQLAGFDDRDPFVERCRGRMLQSLSGRKEEIGSLAGEMCVSVRTLQRRLAAAGTSFSALLDEARYTRAMQLLHSGVTDPHILASIAGYSDARALYRAFRRWTGLTPKEFSRRE